MSFAPASTTTGGAATVVIDGSGDTGDARAWQAGGNLVVGATADGVLKLLNGSAKRL